MPIKVTSIRALVPFKLQMTFNDGMMGTLDCSLLLDEWGDGVRELRERAYFNKVRLENGVPTWPNHFDVSAEWLYEELQRRGLLEKPLMQRRKR